ncbi:hypothetical protein GF359_07645 [candidate division WOR-3 bacterium]|uniref:Tetratricopeptide repeat protein n=1 Tax=candidate division WOR-3 bacterium TaxID=2052148 RepID=A0A9D5KBF1_UNCW3|nr:hypothetical protein [candidate division WOR-3 bacterium]MBD3365074.1 hypothetical protein [candidate division WOR-3 bacterium]
MFVFTLIMLFSQTDGLGYTIEAAEEFERKPDFDYPIPAWVTTEYLFELSGFSLTEDEEKAIDEAILFSQLGGSSPSSVLRKPASFLSQAIADTALVLLDLELKKPLSPQLRRQIYLYKITAYWLKDNPDGAARMLAMLAKDTAGNVEDLSFLYDLVFYWENGYLETTDSLLYYLFQNRNEGKALKFLPSNPEAATALRYHLDERQKIEPAGATGSYLRAHRLLRRGEYSQARDSLTAIYNLKTPFSPFIRFDLTSAMLALDDATSAREVLDDSFPPPNLISAQDIALLRVKLAFKEGRDLLVREYFKKAAQKPAYELYIRWITEPGSPQTESAFTKFGARDLYSVLPVVKLIREKGYKNTLPALEGLFNNLDIFGSSPMVDVITSLYVVAENDTGNYEVTIGMADAIAERGRRQRERNYFLSLAHLAVGDAFYYKKGHFEFRSRPFYAYASQCPYAELSNKAHFSLAWSYLDTREFESTDSVITILAESTLTPDQEELLTFLKGLVTYAERDFEEAAEIFTGLTLSSDPQRQMQGYYYRARSYEQAGKPELTARAYDELLSRFPDEEDIRDAWPRLVRAQLEKDDLDGAKKTLQRLVKEARKHHFKFTDLYKDILRMIYDASLASGDVEHAREIAERLSSTEGSSLILEAFYYQQGEDYTELWQVDDLLVTVNRLTEVNEESAYLPPLLLQLAKMEIELADYDSATVRLEKIMQWPEQGEVKSLLPEVHYHRIRIAVLQQNWDKVISAGEIYALTYPEYEEYTARVLLLRVMALVGRAENAKPFDRKKDINEALADLNLLESKYKDTAFFEKNTEEIEFWRETAEAYTK